MLTYTPRPKVYSVIRENDVAHMNKVGWRGLGIFNLTSNGWIEKNSECVWYGNLTLVRDVNDGSDGDTGFVKHYFNHDGIQWDLSDLTLV